VVTIKDIAERTGFSPTTISLVLNNKRLARYIAATTKQLIRDTARELGYRPNIFARSLRARRSYMVGLLVYDLLDPYCSPIIKRIEATLLPHDYTVLISDVGYCQDRFAEALDVLIGRRVDGIIAIANHFPVNLEQLAKAAQHTPVTVIGRNTQRLDLPSFLVADLTGGQMSAQHLLKLGHRQIACIWDRVAYEWSALRWKGVKSALDRARVTIREGLLARVEEKSADAGFHAAKKLLASGQRFTAILAVNDLTAFGAIRAAVAAGKRVPEDISVIGFDDLSLARHYNPPLTTIRQPLEQLGELATKGLLTRMIDRNRAVSSVTLRPKLVRRESTAKVRR
jgi:LacI family transcriptional regulator